MSETTHTGQFHPIIDFVIYEPTKQTTTMDQPPLYWVRHGTTQQTVPEPPRWLSARLTIEERKNPQIPFQF